PNGSLASPRRSTVPLLDYWRQPLLRLEHLSDALKAERLDGSTLCFEYAVSVRGGVGKASYTDLMILAQSSAVAIEAKFKEPPYETVEKWLRQPEEPNRRKVLDGWLELIRSTARVRLDSAVISALPYQLIHRLASVCSVDRPTRYLIYQIFAEE